MFWGDKMIRLFKDLWIILIVSWATFFVVTITLELVLITFLDDIPIALLMIAFASAMLIAFFLLNHISHKRYKAIAYILDEHCDPYAFLEKMYELKKRNAGYILNKLTILNVAIAYNNIGDIENMQKALDDINGKFMHPVITALKMCLQSNTYFQRGEFENCRLLLNQAKDINDKSIRNKENKRTVEFSYTTGIASLQIRQGQTDGVEELLVPYLSPDRYMLERVSALYILAELYYLQGRAEEEIQALQFVAQNGNRLYIADKARKRLSEIHKLS